MSTKSRWHLAGSLAAVVFAAIATLDAQSASPPQQFKEAPPLDPALAFQVAFGMSFVYFDQCGDRAAGELYRRAVLEKFAHCPFPDEVRKNFSAWTSSNSAEATKQIEKYYAEHDKPPDHVDGLGSCQDYRASARYLKTRALLDQYARGEIDADTLIFPCDTRGGSP